MLREFFHSHLRGSPTCQRILRPPHLLANVRQRPAVFGFGRRVRDLPAVKQIGRYGAQRDPSPPARVVAAPGAGSRPARSHSTQVPIFRPKPERTSAVGPKPPTAWAPAPAAFPPPAHRTSPTATRKATSRTGSRPARSHSAPVSVFRPEPERTSAIGPKPPAAWFGPPRRPGPDRPPGHPVARGRHVLGLLHGPQDGSRLRRLRAERSLPPVLQPAAGIQEVVPEPPAAVPVLFSRSVKSLVSLAGGFSAETFTP